MSQRIHIVHVVYRFAAGGLENVIVQLINGLPRERFHHTVVALTSVDPDFRQRVQQPDVNFIALDKPPGQPFALYPRFFRLLKQLRADVFHSCNIAALEFAPVAAAAGVPLRIHAEHGWDVADPDGSNRKYQWLRRIYQRFVSRFVVVSAQLQAYLTGTIGIDPDRVLLIPNGVDTQRFSPQTGDEPRPVGYPFERGQHWVIGAVGRLEPIKNHLLLARAFVRWQASHPAARASARLAIIGAGPLRDDVQAVLAQAGLADHVWLPGTRSDVPALLKQFDCFVLPSLAEGTSCTLQEAMATGMHIVATDVGDNRRLLCDGEHGELVPSADDEAMAAALARAWRQAGRGASARAHIVQHYGIEGMLKSYVAAFSKRPGGEHD
jgi:sugar transferase (PEP-CTERM/EpsH1 system associated)